MTWQFVDIIQEHEAANLLDWDRLARTDHIRLAIEEDSEDAEPQGSTCSRDSWMIG